MTPPAFPFTLYPGRAGTLLLLALCVAFVAAGVWMIREGNALGWLCAGLFGFGIPVVLLRLSPWHAFLTASEDGFEFRSLFRSHKLHWSDVSEFGVCTIRLRGLPVNRMVGFNYSANYRPLPRARAAAKALAGFEGALPDTYDLSAEELARLLEECRRAWIRREAIRAPPA